MYFEYLIFQKYKSNNNMNTKSNVLVIAIFFSLLAFTSSAQKLFQVSIKFFSRLNTNKVKIFYNTGKEWKKAKLILIDNEVSISDSFYSRFATISCMYYANDKGSSFSSSFFVWDDPATIIIKENKDTLANPFSDYILNNGFDMAKTEYAKKLKEFTSVEYTDYDNFVRIAGSETAWNDSLKTIGNTKHKTLFKKEIDFVRQNGSQYYSLWLFKNEFLNADEFLSPDSLLKIFDETFTPELKNSFEGKQVTSALTGRINIEENDFIPYFKSVDIENKIVDLNNFKGKYVLLNFWASWCGPCLAEFGTIKNFYDKYGKKTLVVISVSIDQDKQAFSKAVKKYQMNWINIFHDIAIENVFLKSGGIPQVYLIDRDGKLIYSREKEKDYDLLKLKKILEKAM